MTAARLVDTNVLVYAYDPRYPEKQRVAAELLRRGFAGDDFVVPHQAVIEFAAAVLRPRPDLGGEPLLAWPALDSLMRKLIDELEILYPDREVVRTALLGAAAYQLSWYDAHLWAYAEANGLDELVSEDFEHGRYYGRVRAHDPFLTASDEVHELPPMYEAD